MIIASSLAVGGALYATGQALNIRKKKKRNLWLHKTKTSYVPKNDREIRKLFSSLVDSGKIFREEGQKWVQLPWFNDLRRQQMKEISSSTNEIEISLEEKRANRHLTLSFVSLSLTSVGTLFFPPLNLLGASILIYIWMPIFRPAYNSLFNERRVSVHVLDLLFTPLLILTGYYFVASISFVVYYLSEKLVSKTENHSKQGLVDIFGEQPRFAWILQNEIEIEIPFEALKKNDIVVISAGETIPIDGIITYGIASIDQRILTGEAQPVEKEIGDQVFAMTVILSGRIHVRAEQAGDRVVAAQIRQILIQTDDFKESMRLQALELADKMVPLRILFSALAFPILGPAGALTVLNARFGYVMRILGPLGLLNFLQIASQKGILVKDGRSLELLSKVDTVVFDKTGTLTQERPHVSKVYAFNNYTENELLQYAAAIEDKQTHPIALAIRDEVIERGLTLPEIEKSQYEVGYGIKAHISNRLVRVGSSRFMHMEGVKIPYEICEIEHKVHEIGDSIVFIAVDDDLSGAIELKPTIRPEAKHIVASLQKRGKSIYVVSGDHAMPTQKLAEALGIDHYFSEILPENKADIVEQLQNEGRCVCFVGDGINDSIALKKADVSISLRGASSIAIDTAQIVLMDQRLDQLDQLFYIADGFKSTSNKVFLTTVIPQAIIVGGAFFLGFNILSSIALNQIGLAIGVGYSMQPLIKHQKEIRG